MVVTGARHSQDTTALHSLLISTVLFVHLALLCLSCSVIMSLIPERHIPWLKLLYNHAHLQMARVEEIQPGQFSRDVYGNEPDH